MVAIQQNIRKGQTIMENDNSMDYIRESECFMKFDTTGKAFYIIGTIINIVDNKEITNTNKVEKIKNALSILSECSKLKVSANE